NPKLSTTYQRIDFSKKTVNKLYNPKLSTTYQRIDFTKKTVNKLYNPMLSTTYQRIDFFEKTVNKLLNLKDWFVALCNPSARKVGHTKHQSATMMMGYKKTYNNLKQNTGNAKWQIP
ncbi:hypothetical protein SERLA73DRAFT_157561, partial [Serpula lacrymans var. lacrymans S7.3]